MTDHWDIYFLQYKKIFWSKENLDSRETINRNHSTLKDGLYIEAGPSISLQSK